MITYDSPRSFRWIFRCLNIVQQDIESGNTTVNYRYSFINLIYRYYIHVRLSQKRTCVCEILLADLLYVANDLLNFSIANNLGTWQLLKIHWKRRGCFADSVFRCFVNKCTNKKCTPLVDGSSFTFTYNWKNIIYLCIPFPSQYGLCPYVNDVTYIDWNSMGYMLLTKIKRPFFCK